MKRTTVLILVFLLGVSTVKSVISETQIVTGGDYDFVQFKQKIPPTGASLQLTVQKGGTKLIQSCKLNPDLEGAPWKEQGGQPGQSYVFGASNVLPGQEWVRIIGSYNKPPGQPGGKGGGVVKKEVDPEFTVSIPTANLKLAGVDDKDEETVGARIRNNGPGRMIELTLYRVKPDATYTNKGTITLTSAALTAGQIKLWKDKNCTTTAPAVYANNTTTIPDDGLVLWVEGKTKSTTALDVAITAQYQKIPNGTILAEDTVKLTVANIAMKLEQVGPTVINTTDDKYAEDTTIRVTAVDEDTGATIAWFKGKVEISEQPKNTSLATKPYYQPIYDQNGGHLPPSVEITANGTTNFTARSLAGPDTKRAEIQRKPADAEITSGNYPVLQVAGKTHPIEGINYLPVKQWVDNGVVHTLAEPGTPDWLEARTKKFFDDHPDSGDVGKVLRKIKSYKVAWLIKADGEARSVPGGQGTVTFNPYNNSTMRLNWDFEGKEKDYCVTGVNKSHFHTILHEARHCYQGFIATMENDADGDGLVKTVPIWPTQIILDNDTERDVWQKDDDCGKAKYKGDSVRDAEEDLVNHQGVKNAIERDAAEFATSHDQ